MQSSHSTLLSIVIGNIISTCWWFQTTKACSIYILVRDLSALIHGRTKYHGYTHVCPYCLYCFTKARLLTAYLSDCSVHPEQKVEYPSPDDPEKNINKFKAIAKSLPVPFVLYADFEAFLVPAEETKDSASNIKVRQLHKPSGFACLRVSQVPEFTGEIFMYSGENSMTVFFEHIKDQDRYVRSIPSDVKPMKTLTAEQQLQHAADTSCEQCRCQFTKKIKRRNITVILADFTSVRIAIRAIWNLNIKKVPTPIQLTKRRRKHQKGNKPNSSTVHSKNSSKKRKTLPEIMTTSILLLTWWQKIRIWSPSSFTIWGGTTCT